MQPPVVSLKQVIYFIVVMMELQLALMPLNKTKGQLDSSTAICRAIVGFIRSHTCSSFAKIRNRENSIHIIFFK